MQRNVGEMIISGTSEKSLGVGGRGGRSRRGAAIGSGALRGTYRYVEDVFRTVGLGSSVPVEKETYDSRMRAKCGQSRHLAGSPAGIRKNKATELRSADPERPTGGRSGGPN